MKIWISQDYESGEYFMYDHRMYLSCSGPFEISNELYEHIREFERVYDVMQNILASLVYDWKSSEGRLADCD